jgi:hypothetical protein
MHKIIKDDPEYILIKDAPKKGFYIAKSRTGSSSRILITELKDTEHIYYWVVAGCLYFEKDYQTLVYKDITQALEALVMDYNIYKCDNLKEICENISK